MKWLFYDKAILLDGNENKIIDHLVRTFKIVLTSRNYNKNVKSTFLVDIVVVDDNFLIILELDIKN